MNLLHQFLDLLYPPKCPFCGRVLERGEEGWCSLCQEELPWTRAGEEKAVGGCDVCLSPVWYRDAARDGVHRYKFHGGQSHARPFGTLMAQCLNDRWDKPVDLVTWAPLHPRRKRKRGYDQAELLARVLASELDKPAVPALRKARDTVEQSSLDDEAARAQNAAGAYEIADRLAVQGKRVLLVDDIVTSGSTLSNCAQILLDAGANEVWTAVFARARE